MKLILTSLALSVTLSGCPHLPAPSGCSPSTSTCIDDRPQVCSGTQRWSAVGDATCASLGAVCCMTADGVHACVPQSACTGE